MLFPDALHKQDVTNTGLHQVLRRSWLHNMYGKATTTFHEIDPGGSQVSSIQVMGLPCNWMIRGRRHVIRRLWCMYQVVTCIVSSLSHTPRVPCVWNKCPKGGIQSSWPSCLGSRRRHGKSEAGLMMGKPKSSPTSPGLHVMTFASGDFGS